MLGPRTAAGLIGIIMQQDGVVVLGGRPTTATPGLILTKILDTEANVADEVKFDETQQTRVNELVGAARVKARDQAQADFETAQAKAKEEAEKAALMAEAKWQELAQKHEARATELAPFETEAKAYRELVTGMLKDRVKELGEAAKKAVDGLPGTLTDLDKLAWLNTNAKLFEEAGDGVGTPKRVKSKSGKLSAKDAGHRRLRM